MILAFSPEQGIYFSFLFLECQFLQKPLSFPEGISDMVGVPPPRTCLSSFTSIVGHLDVTESPTGQKVPVPSGSSTRGTGQSEMSPQFFLLCSLGPRISEPGPLATECWTRLSTSKHGYDGERQPKGQTAWRAGWCGLLRGEREHTGSATCPSKPSSLRLRAWLPKATGWWVVPCSG